MSIRHLRRAWVWGAASAILWAVVTTSTAEDARPEKPAEDKAAVETPPLPSGDIPALKLEKLRSSGGGRVVNLSIGWEFETTASVKVTALGLWDFDGKGLDVETPIGLWEISGKRLVEARLPAGKDIEIIDKFCYVRIDPVILPAGKRYVVAALYTPQLKENDVSHGGADASFAGPITWRTQRTSKSETLTMPEPTPPSAGMPTPFGCFGPNFLLARDEASAGERVFYTPQQPRRPPAQPKPDIVKSVGGPAEEKVVTISLYALPNGELTQILIGETPLGVGELGFAKLANEMERYKSGKAENRPRYRLATMSSVRAGDLHQALGVLESGEFRPRSDQRLVSVEELGLMRGARLKQPAREGRYIDETRFRETADYIEDRWTGLLWQKDATSAGKKNFYEARDYAAQLKLGGRTGWRVPNIEELATIFPADFRPFTDAKYNPKSCCDGDQEFASYWTSQLDLPQKDYAFVYHWYAAGGANNCFASKNQAYVRCVHDPVKKQEDDTHPLERSPKD